MKAILLALVVALGASAARADEWSALRERMVEGQLAGRDIRDRNVLRVMRTVPRHEFVPVAERMAGYDDCPLPIGHGQTISQPYIVAYMTQLLKLNAGARTLEIGTGSGYQAAVLAGMTRTNVYTIEIIPPLAAGAAATLKRLGYTQIEVRTGDGYYGWPERAPFDAIIVTAAADHVPPPLVKQLKPGGRMVIPVGGVWMTQYLVVVDKLADGTVRTTEDLPVRFVPLTGKGLARE